MPWILRDCHNNLIVMPGSIPLLLELCPDAGKPPLLHISKFSADSQTIALPFENRASQPNLYCQTPLVVPTFSIESP